MKRTLVSCLLVASLAVGLAGAQSVVVPNANATAVGTTQLNSLVRESPRTVQQGIHASELVSIPAGAVIVGLSYRVYRTSSASWPATSASWNNYEVTLAEGAVATSLWTSTFAANMKNPVLVRKGPLTIPANAFPGTTAKPNPFDTFYLAFQQQYVYQGGDLVVHITHDGNNIANTTFFDGVSSGASGRTMYALSYQAATATTTSTTFVITRIHYGYGPSGCVGSNGTLNLILSNNLLAPTPAPGSINVAVTNGRPAVAGGILLSPIPLARPIPLPGACRLLIFPAFIANLPISLNAAGRYDLNLTFPTVKFTLEAQAYAVDSSAPAGYVASNAINLTVSP